MAAIPISIGFRSEYSTRNKVEELPYASTDQLEAIGSLAIPRDPRDELLQPTAKWQITGAVGPGEIGPGCPLKCTYCNQRSFDVSQENEKLAGYISINDGGTSLNTRLMVDRRVERQITPQVLLEELSNNPLYDKEGWLLLENFNDPGMNWRQSCKLIEGLVDLGHTGPMTFITKMGLPEKYAAKLGELREKGAKLTGIVSYANLPVEIEPAPVETRLTTLRRLKEVSIPTIVSMRPLIEGINLNDESIAKVLAETKDYTDLYIAGGLFVFDEWTPDVFRDAGYPLSENYLSASYDVAKVAPEALHKVVQRVAEQQGFDDVKVLPHTTCAIATMMTTKYDDPHYDRLAHWVGHDEPGPVFDTHCIGCPPAQQAACRSVGEASADEITQTAQEVLTRLGYPDAEVMFSEEQPGYLLVKDMSLTFGEQSFIRQSTGMYVNNLPSLEGLIYRTYETVTEDVKASFLDSFVGATQVGEEWYVFIDGDLDGKQNANTIRRIRSWNRARVQLVNASEIQEDSGYDAAKVRLIDAGLDPEATGNVLAEVRRRQENSEERARYKQHLKVLLQHMGKEL